MLEFLDRCCTEFIDALIDAFYNFVRMALAAARLLNAACYLIAATFLFGFALVLVGDLGDKVPAINVAAFLIAWLALALAIDGLEQLARSEPEKAVTADHRLLLDDRAIEDGTVSVLPSRRRTTDW
jgi:hypothetical protein